MRYDFAIQSESVRNGTRYLLVDTAKAHFQRLPWNQLGDFGKRKMENMLFLTRMNISKQKLKILYATTS